MSPAAYRKHLQEMRSVNVDARRVFDALRRYEHKTAEVNVDMLYRRCSLKRTLIRKVLEELSSLGLGEVVLGRRGGKTRFVWFEKEYWSYIPGPSKEELRSVAVAKPAKDTKIMMELSVPLSAGRTARLSFPLDPTLAELQAVAKRLGDLIKSKPPTKP